MRVLLDRDNWLDRRKRWSSRRCPPCYWSQKYRVEEDAMAAKALK